MLLCSEPSRWYAHQGPLNEPEPKDEYLVWMGHFGLFAGVMDDFGNLIITHQHIMAAASAQAVAYHYE